MFHVKEGSVNVNLDDLKVMIECNICGLLTYSKNGDKGKTRFSSIRWICFSLRLT